MNNANRKGSFGSISVVLLSTHPNSQFLYQNSKHPCSEYLVCAKELYSISLSLHNSQDDIRIILSSLCWANWILSQMTSSSSHGQQCLCDSKVHVFITISCCLLKKEQGWIFSHSYHAGAEVLFGHLETTKTIIVHSFFKGITTPKLIISPFLRCPAFPSLIWYLS